MSEYPIHHKIRVNYINEAKESDTREVPIYQIGINKKNFCKPFAAVENRNGVVENVPRCQNYKSHNTCSECIKLAKAIDRMNHG
jgi:hypothetical protein